MNLERLERIQSNSLAINNFLRSLIAPIDVEESHPINKMIEGVHLDIVGKNGEGEPLFCLKVPLQDDEGELTGDHDVFYEDGETIDAMICYTQGVFHGLYMMGVGASVISAQRTFPREFSANGGPKTRTIKPETIQTAMEIYKLYSMRFKDAFEKYSDAKRGENDE